MTAAPNPFDPAGALANALDASAAWRMERDRSDAVAAEQLANLRAAGFDVVRAGDPAGLTERQRDCLLAIQRAVDATGVTPTFQELADTIGLASKSGIHRLCHGLSERGWIGLTPFRARAITLLRRLQVDDRGEGEI